MEQTRLLLIKAREDYSQALNIMCLVQLHTLPTTIEDMMYGYMVAKDWCLWIKNPGAPKEGPVLFEVEGKDEMLSMIQVYVERFEYELFKAQAAIEEYVAILDPNLKDCWCGFCESPSLREDTRLLFRALRYTAQLFEEKFDDNRFNKLLDEKQIPSMSELDRCLSGKTEFKH